MVLEVEDLTVPGDRKVAAVRGVSLRVHRNEILGIAGVSGNGQRELVEAITGLRRASSGAVRLNGADVTNASARVVASKGIGHVPEERIRFGIVPNLFVYENSVLKQHRNRLFSRVLFLNYGSIRQHASALVKDFSIAAPSLDTPVRSLSGGNIQKLILGREIRGEPALLVAAHPTYGLDVGATEYIRRQLLELRERGTAVLLVSEDLEEIFELADRVAVLFDGRLMGILNTAEASMEQIGLMMAGSSPAEEGALVSLQPQLESLPAPSSGRKLAVLVLSLLAGFAAMSIVFAANQVNPLFALKEILLRSFGSPYGLKETVTKAIPLILIGSGLTLAFRARFWNIGAESQLLLGAMAATWVGLQWGTKLPSALLFPLMFLAGFLAGALWGLIPALLRVRFAVNEVISTLMLNYVAAELLTLLITGPWRGALPARLSLHRAPGRGGQAAADPRHAHPLPHPGHRPGRRRPAVPGRAAPPSSATSCGSSARTRRRPATPASTSCAPAWCSWS